MTRISGVQADATEMHGCQHSLNLSILQARPATTFALLLLQVSEGSAHKQWLAAKRCWGACSKFRTSIGPQTWQYMSSNQSALWKNAKILQVANSTLTVALLALENWRSETVTGVSTSVRLSRTAKASYSMHSEMNCPPNGG
jgi:hypothetical protein